MVIIITLILGGCGNAKREVAIVTWDYVYFRTTPDASRDDNILCQIVKGEKVEIIESEGEWYKVLYWGQEGYLYKMSLTISGYEYALDPRDYEMKGVIIYKYVNYRSEPFARGTDNIIGRINKGQEVDVIAFKNGWMEVKHEGEQGNVIGKSLRVHLVRKQKETSSGTIGVIVYEYVNQRTEPSTKSEIIDEIYFGTKVEVLSVDGDWVKIRYNGKVGYIISKSVSTGIVILDISDYNWGSEFSSIEEFKEFIKLAQENLNFGGVYVQVLRDNYENPYWKAIVQTLDEMEVPYGLYNYTRATSKEEAQEQYRKFQKIIAGTRIKFNRFPLMIDLEGMGNQSEVLKFYNELGEDYIVYASANDMVSYGYYEKALQFWVAHYDLVATLPTKPYTEYPKARDELTKYALWQFTSSGNKTLLGTDHLDMNLVAPWWWEKYN